MGKMGIKEAADLQKRLFAERLVSLRKGAGLTQKQLAEKSGYTGSVIARYEAGQVLPRPEAIERLARALGVSVPDLEGSTSTAERVKLQNKLKTEMAKFDIQADFKEADIILSGPDIGVIKMPFPHFAKVFSKSCEETERRLASLKEKYLYELLKINLLEADFLKK